MNDGQMGAVIRHLRNDTGGADGATDEHLLQQFAHHRDGAAFAALVERHGPMMLGVCRRVLRDLQDADDAFQATFLILVHKTSSITRPQALGSWLYHTALRTARRAKTRRDQRRNQESVLDDLPAAEATEDLAWHELRPALDEEVSRLPRKYRDAIVSCYFQERTYAEAAKNLGLAAGTVSSRLARARDILRKRLLHRGLTLSAGLLITLLSRAALAAAVRSTLQEATTAAAVRLVTGEATLTAAATSSVSILTREVIRTMYWTKLKFGTLVVLSAVCAGATALCHNRITGGQDGASRAEATASNAAFKDGEKNANGATVLQEPGKKAAEIKSRHDYDPTKLPSLVKVKAGESIVVTYTIKPEDVEETKARSDNGDVTVKGEAGKASFQIVIRSDKKGNAKINWEIIQVTGRVEGWKDLEVEFE